LGGGNNDVFSFISFIYLFIYLFIIIIIIIGFVFILTTMGFIMPWWM